MKMRFPYERSESQERIPSDSHDERSEESHEGRSLESPHSSLDRVRIAALERDIELAVIVINIADEEHDPF
jgi:hypothetical protein